MAKVNNLLDYEKEVKLRLGKILNALNISQAVAAKRMGCSPATLSRRLNPADSAHLDILFCEEFACAFCGGEIALLLSDKREDDDAVAHAFDMRRVFYGLPADIQQGIYERAVSEGDALRAALKRQ